MTKTRHEFRDPIHTFIGVSDDERMLIDSEPVQRLRHIHQLAMSYLVYPGATHRRFEHSLGVMELAGRVFDTVTDPRNLKNSPSDVADSLADVNTGPNWRRTLRAAALCHDIGHLPFSHAAEADLLPAGWSHEGITVELIRSEPMEHLWGEKLEAGLRGKEVAKLAVGPKHYSKHYAGELLGLRESVLSEIITGDAFGVDRIDYLLRDSLHTGVAYGRFDHYRLIDTLRILSKPNDGEDVSDEPQLGIEEGGLQSAEALAMARYFMYSQVYFHRVRRIFDIHLKDFLKEHLESRPEAGFFPTDPKMHLLWTDSEVMVALREAARVSGAPGHDAARRIVDRDPYKLLWARTPAEAAQNLNIGEDIAQAISEQFDEGEKSVVRRDSYLPNSPFIDFPVLQRDGSVVSARAISSVLENLPATSFDFVFVRPDVHDPAERWLRKNLGDLLSKPPKEED